MACRRVAVVEKKPALSYRAIIAGRFLALWLDDQLVARSRAQAGRRPRRRAVLAPKRNAQLLNGARYPRSGNALLNGVAVTLAPAGNPQGAGGLASGSG